jgi:hypothetical protein
MRNVDVIQPNPRPPQPPPPPKPKRVRRKSAKAKPRPAYDPQVGAEIYRLLVGWRGLTPEQLEDRIREIRRLATRCHLGPPVWAAIDKMRTRLRAGVYARSGDMV